MIENHDLDIHMILVSYEGVTYGYTGFNVKNSDEMRKIGFSRCPRNFHIFRNPKIAKKLLYGERSNAENSLYREIWNSAKVVKILSSTTETIYE